MSELKAQLDALRNKVSDEDLTDGGRYFADSLSDYAQCGHGETGNPQLAADGKLVELLWNGYRSGAIGVLPVDSDGPTTSPEVAAIASALLKKPAHELVGLGGDAAHELKEQIRTVAASALGQHR